MSALRGAAQYECICKEKWCWRADVHTACDSRVSLQMSFGPMDSPSLIAGVHLLGLVCEKELSSCAPSCLCEWTNLLYRAFNFFLSVQWLMWWGDAEWILWFLHASEAAELPFLYELNSWSPLLMFPFCQQGVIVLVVARSRVFGCCSM